jgi:hypothetical protein
MQLHKGLCMFLFFVFFVAIFSLSQVQNFLGDEGDFRPPPSNPQIEGGTSPFWQPPDVIFGWGAAPKKWSLFLTTFLKQKTVFGA